MSVPTPLVEFFKRGEVDRDVRLLAAQGAIAPRAHEQLGILIILVDDADPEIRRTAAETLDRIPREALVGFLARPDVPIAIREFFADRGIFPAETPPLAAGDDPLLDTSADEGVEDEALLGAEGADPTGDAGKLSVTQRLARMNFPERLKAAMKGSREVRAVLVRDPNKMISAAVLSSPKLTEQEVESFVRMGSVSEDVLRIIGTNRAWTKNYSIILGHAKNPKTPIAMSLNLMARLTDGDVKHLSTDRNVPEPLRIAARKRAVSARK